MSQHRQRAQNDYLINLNAELEIQYLNEKTDHLLLLTLNLAGAVGPDHPDEAL